ncbi:MAG: hypothetical protein HY724_04980, partial [Candidatus Rokubacteria bacterium]|nr:hypothetical protein [Candidatus Rokubacteria bacterium]
FDPAALAEITAMNRLRRVELLDRDGRPYSPPPPPRGMMGMMLRGHGAGEIREPHRSMMLYMWGRQWSPPREESEPAPPAVKERKFWEGSLFGVAIGARSFPGIIAVHADADYVLNFRKEIGVERQIQELARQSGVEEVVLLGPDLTVLAHSDPGRIGQRDDEPGLAAALGQRKNLSRLVRRAAGRTVFEVVRPLALDGARLGLLRIALSTEPMERVRRENLRSALALGLAVLLAGALGMGVIFYTQYRHLGEVRALEAEVQRRERLSALGNLAAAVAHEVRNPLNAISVGLQRLREEFRPAGDEAEYSRFVDLMQGEVRRLNAIVEEFLSLARPLALKPESVGVGELLQEVTALVRADAEARGVRLALRVSPDLQAARLDPDHMKQVLLNLILNALEAMPGGGTLTISASPFKESLLLSVEDTGDGVPSDLLPRIFEPYVTTKARGMGLGLPIARRIVEAHGGRIEVETQPKQGSRFTITLPLSGPASG